MDVLDPFRFVVISVAGWMNQQQREAIDYLREENRVLREQLGDRRLRFTDVHGEFTETAWIRWLGRYCKHLFNVAIVHVKKCRSNPFRIAKLT